MVKILIALSPLIVLAFVFLAALIYDLLGGRKCTKEHWEDIACDFTADLGAIKTYYHTDPDGYGVGPYRIWHQESDTFIRVDYRDLRKYNKWRKELEADRRTKAANERQREDIEAQLKFTQDVVQKAVDRKKQEVADMVKPLVAPWEKPIELKADQNRNGSIAKNTIAGHVVPHMFWNGEWVPITPASACKQSTKVKPRKVVKQ